MRDEIAAAVLFITRLLKKNENLSPGQIEAFSNRLSSVMLDRFRDHWYNEEPRKGQAYRCIRVNHSEPADPTINLAANACGLHYYDLNLPTELTVWVDPTEVTCRLGEIKASECILLSKRNENSGKSSATVDIDRLLEKHHAWQQKQREKYQMLWSSRRSDTDKSGFQSTYKNSHQNRAMTRTDYHHRNGSQSPSGYQSYSPVGSPILLHKYQNNVMRNRNNSNRSKNLKFNNYSGPPPSHPTNQNNWVRGADLVMA